MTDFHCDVYEKQQHQEIDDPNDPMFARFKISPEQFLFLQQITQNRSAMDIQIANDISKDNALIRLEQAITIANEYNQKVKSDNQMEYMLSGPLLTLLKVCKYLFNEESVNQAQVQVDARTRLTLFGERKFENAVVLQFYY
eukprot:403335353